jgi:hypothetical protein
MVARTSADWSGGNVVAMVAQVSQERADSLRYRMNSEDLLIDHARKRLTFGWGGWSRSHVFDERGKDLTVLDGLWIAALGQKGVVGLLALTGLILLPALLWMRVPRRIRTLPLAVAGQATSLVLPLYMLDCLANAMVNPVYSVAAGGLMTVVLSICARTSDRNMGVRVRVARLPYQIAAAKHYYEQ